MIFKQIDEILRGEKTQTRRNVKPNEYGAIPLNNPSTYSLPANVQTVYSGTRRKWQVGRDYAVQPKRGAFGIEFYPAPRVAQWREMTPDRALDDRYRPVRIRITEIRMENLQDISRLDALAEGHPFNRPVTTDAEITPHPPEPLDWYRALWDSINARKGMRWEDNPDVWVLTFYLVG